MKSNHIQKGTIGDSSITIGPYTYGFEFCRVFGHRGKSLSIGSFCSIARETKIFLGANHRTDWITTFPFGHQFIEEFGGPDTEGHPSSNGNVSIGNDVWIGYGATIMSGVTIGDGAVVAANAHVVKNVLPYEIVGGNPAQQIRFRFNQEIIALLLELRWWDLPIDTIKEYKKILCAPPNGQILKSLIESIKSNGKYGTQPPEK